MGFFRKLGGFLGLGHGDAVAATHGDDPAVDGVSGDGAAAEKIAAAAPPVGTRRGFSVQVPVAVDRTVVGPVLAPCTADEGTVQGFRWYTRRLRIDEDGDVADELLEEVTVADEQFSHSQPPQLQTKYNTRPTALSMRRHTVVRDGNVLQCLDYGGELKWV